MNFGGVSESGRKYINSEAGLQGLQNERKEKEGVKNVSLEQSSGLGYHY